MSHFHRFLPPVGLSLALALTVLAGSNAACGGAPAAMVKAASSSPASTPAAAIAPAPDPAPAPSGASSAQRLFTGSGAAWLYAPPTGTGINIASVTSGMHFSVNAHDGGFDYPIQFADGSLGCTSFTDTSIYGLNDQFCAPNPAGGFAPSVGGWGANDGHLVIVDLKTSTYYDFWKLTVDSHGNPTTTNVGEIRSGSLDGNGIPGTTAANLTGLAGDILPGELDCSDCLQHALSVIVPGTMNSPQLGHQAPISQSDGKVAGAIFREGAKIQLDPNLDVDALQASTAAKAVMKALQRYGGVITDQTGGAGISFYSALGTTPDLTGLDQIGGHLLLFY